MTAINKPNIHNEQMRRFTFASLSAVNRSAQIADITVDKRLISLMQKAGIINFNYCQKKNISYLVLDMEEHFNLSATQNLFQKLSIVNLEFAPLSQMITTELHLLDRIYKMEQKNEYMPIDGQLIPLPKKDYTRFILNLEIINDEHLAQEYCAVHGIGKAWPQITQNMKTVGIYEMELYLSGFQAFLIMDTKPNFDWAVDGVKWGTLPQEKEWQATVAKYQKNNLQSKATEKWEPMNVISMHR